MEKATQNMTQQEIENRLKQMLKVMQTDKNYPDDYLDKTVGLLAPHTRDMGWVEGWILELGRKNNEFDMLDVESRQNMLKTSNELWKYAHQWHRCHWVKRAKKMSDYSNKDLYDAVYD